MSVLLENSCIAGALLEAERMNEDDVGAVVTQWETLAQQTMTAERRQKVVKMTLAAVRKG